MRTYVGELDGFSIYSDSGCPEGTAYIVPGNEILVPEGVLMTDAIIELLRKFKNLNFRKDLELRTHSQEPD